MFWNCCEYGFIMICTYEKDGADPELLLYKKR